MCQCSCAIIDNQIGGSSSERQQAVSEQDTVAGLPRERVAVIFSGRVTGLAKGYLLGYPVPVDRCSFLFEYNNTTISEIECGGARDYQAFLMLIQLERTRENRSLSQTGFHSDEPKLRLRYCQPA